MFAFGRITELARREPTVLPASFVVRNVDAGIRLSALPIRAAATLPRPDGIRCDACHSTNHLAVVRDLLVPGFIALRCDICTSQCTVDADI